MKSGVRARGVLEDHPVYDGIAGMEAVLNVFQIDRFLLQGAPQPFKEDVVETITPMPVHRDADVGFGRRCCACRSGGLRSLVCIRDFKRAEPGDGLV